MQIEVKRGTYRTLEALIHAIGVFIGEKNPNVVSQAADGSSIIIETNIEDAVRRLQVREIKAEEIMQE